MLQGLDHLLNFLLTPLGTGLVFALLAKGVFWRASLSGLSWRQAVVRAMGGAMAGFLLGVAITQQDGKMLGMGLMLLGAVLPLWWKAR